MKSNRRIVQAFLVAAFLLTTMGVASAQPVGTVLAFAGKTPPGGFLLCDGSAVDRKKYGPLFNAIGTTYGDGDGSTTFNLPDLRGRSVFGKDDMNGTTAAGRLTAAGSGVDGTTLGAAGGTEKHTLTAAELPSHAHPVTDGGHNHPFADYGGGLYKAISNSNTGIPQGTFITMPLVGYGLCTTNSCDWGMVYGYGDVLGYLGNGFFPGPTNTLSNQTQSNYANVRVQPTGGGGSHPTVSPGIVLNYIIKN